MRYLVLVMAALVAACDPGLPPGDMPDLGDPDAVDPGDDPGDSKFDGPGTAPGTTLVLRGTILTMDEARGANDVIDGAVVIVGGKIQKILAASDPLPTGSGVTVLPSATGASDWVISPGMINLHNHHAYNTARIYTELPLYQNTYQWRDEDYYESWIQAPKRMFTNASAEATSLGLPAQTKRIGYAGLEGRYSEVKEIISGTTSTQGSYFGLTIPSAYGLTLARNLDSTNFGKRRVSQASLGILVANFDPRPLAAKFAANSLDAWLVHLLEGTDQVSRDEFDCLKAMGLVQKQLVIIHGTALTPAQLGQMADVGAKLVISPTDNLMYYGQTPDVETAWKLGMNVSLGTDWSSAGAKNLLSELKVLDLMNKQAYHSVLTDRDIIKMVTANPADAIGWTGYVGRIRPGLYADLAVFTRRTTGTAYRALIDGGEKDVRLVMVGGDPLYGDVDVMTTLKPTDHEQLSTGCGFTKAIDVTSSDVRVEARQLTYAELHDTLQAALQFDPAWVAEHWDAARTAGWTPAQITTQMKKTFPLGLAARDLDPLMVCEDTGFRNELKVDANIRTAYAGICLDLSKWYTTAKTNRCAAAPAKPPLVTVAQHPGTVPERPAAWCAMQNWTGTTLPKPPKK